MSKKFFAKRVLKKMKGGKVAYDEIAKDPKLAGGGAIHKPVKVTPQDVLRKKAHGGDVKKYRGELKSEIKGMGPEGKAYLRDELKDKRYEGKLKGEYKGDLDKELYGMHKKGKEYLKGLVAKKVKKIEDPRKKVYKEIKSLKPKSKVREKVFSPSLGKIIESKALKRKLREKEGIPKKDIVGKAKGGWIQGAVKKPGALRAVAAKEGLIKGDQKLSSSDLSKLGSQAKKSGNSLLAKRVSLAKTFAKMRKKK